MHFKGILSLCGAIVAAVALVSASGATTTKNHNIARIDVSSRAAIVHYLRSIHVNPKGLVIQRGRHNYAGVRCPGKHWTCTRTTQPVVQVAAAGGKNVFSCSAAHCAVFQVAAAAAKPNKATCIRTTGLGASCSITQSSTAPGLAGNNTAMIYENAGKVTGLTQTASYTASIKQQATGAGAGNTGCVDQEINIDGSTTASGKKGSPVTVTLEAHQSVSITQDSLSGNNQARQSWDGMSIGCTGSALTQMQTLTSAATGTGQITQNEDAATNGANVLLQIRQNEDAGFKGSASGPNNATFSQTNTLSAVANTPVGPVSQTQSSSGLLDPPGGVVATVNQDSTGQKTANATQIENQCEDASSTSALAACPATERTNMGPSSLTQNQWGPQKGGYGPSAQTGGDSGSGTFTIDQTANQDKDEGSGGTQENLVFADCQTPGNCTVNQHGAVDGAPYQNLQSGQDVSTSTNCTGSTCTGAPLIVGNNAAFGNGPIQTYDLATGSLVNSFVPDGATPTNANGRAVAVVGNEIFYSELSGDGFGASDGIRVAPFNNGAGGNDLRVLPNPDPSTGIQDLAYNGGSLYALTGYPNGTLRAWKLNPTTGSAIAGPIVIATGTTAADPAADGFTVLPDGNFLINDGDASCTYREYDPTTGQATGQSLTVPGASQCTGVETYGSKLYFQTDFDSFTVTDMSANLISTTNVAANEVEDISFG